ncbi:MAG: hypothetical protein AAF098_11065 [Pseudomonadota bacterium]
MFRLIKYSSILYFLGKHRSKLFRSIAVLLFAFVSSLLYEDVRVYLASQHPETLIYALSVKVLIVYGSLAFVLWQFRPTSAAGATGTVKPSSEKAGTVSRAASRAMSAFQGEEQLSQDLLDKEGFKRLDELTDLDKHDRLPTRYERVLAEGAKLSSRTETPRQESRQDHCE